jgi:hypothetical protein
VKRSVKIWRKVLRWWEGMGEVSEWREASVRRRRRKEVTGRGEKEGCARK